MAREVPEEESYRRADEESRIQKFNKINKENMAIIGIDFDGTCVTDLFPYVGDNIGAASVLRKLADKNLLILYTVRDGKYLQDAVDWFKYNHINPPTPIRRRRRTSDVSIWMWMILCISIRADNSRRIG